MKTDIRQLLSNDIYEALVGANAPNNSNPFATINDLGTGGVTGNGTANTIAMFTGASAIGNSIISQDAGANYALIAGSLLVNDAIQDLTNINAIDVNARSLFYNDGSTVAVDWQNSVLIDDGAFTSIQWGARTLHDAAGNMTVDWENTYLQNNAGNPVLTWDAQGVAIDNGSLRISGSTLTYPQIHLNSGTPPSTPVDGDIWYGTAATTGFNFYSNDPTNNGNMATFSTSVNQFALYIDTVAAPTGLVLFYCPTVTRFGFAANQGATINYEMSPIGNHSWVGGNSTSGAIGSFLFTGGAKTNLTTTVQSSTFAIAHGSTQWATGTLAVQNFIRFTQPTIAFVGASTATLTSTLNILGAPKSGTNATQTTTAGLLISSAAVNSPGTAVTSYGLLSNAQTGATTNYAAGFSGMVQITAGRLLKAQGASVASANNLVLGLDGDTFEITGTTQINLISNLTYQNGSMVTLLFTSTPTVKHNQVTSTTNITILLAGAADFVATANDTLTLILSTVGGVQAWREITRSVI